MALATSSSLSAASVASSGGDGIVTVNAKAFGAVGDGHTDDIVALEKALAAVTASGGGTLFFPRGQYAVSRALLVTGYGITIRGAGMHPVAACNWGSALLSLTSNSTLVVFEHCTSCALCHLTLSHAASTTAGSGASSPSMQQRRQCVAAAAASEVRRPVRRIVQQGQEQQLITPGDRAPTIMPVSGAAVTIRQSFATTLNNLWISHVFAHIAMSEMANTITVLDSQLISAFGPCAVCAAGGIAPPVGLASANMNRTRVDILQMARVTTNNHPSANASVVWIDIGAGVNTVRLDNVGLINGGTGVRMSAPADSPAGEYPGRPLFLLANDLEIDFPSGNAIELLEGEEVQISNGYVQGAGATVMVNRRIRDARLGVGILVGENFNAEVMITNTRIFGHQLSGIELRGGAHLTMCVELPTYTQYTRLHTQL
eukprot:COSAG05_NODE_2859_length_2562_cov_279.182704_2_plen_429_part_00